jgi:orotidine-5'-phosphate decarboxylase
VSAADRICLALDFPGAVRARDFARRFRGRVGWFKIGLELFVSEGPSLVAEISRMGRVFLDLKLHDIPNTAAGAAAAAVRTGASLIDVHASGGGPMMERVRRAAAEEADRLGTARPRVVAVTVLTSLAQDDLSRIGLEGSPAEGARRLARLAQESGLDGVVCSAGDLAGVRAECGADFFTVVPGIRPAGAERADQKRAASPREAIEAGASLLVVGRPITQAGNPEAALEEILREIGSEHA